MHYGITEAVSIILTREIEEKNDMVQAMQTSFNKHRPPKRPNFSSYACILIRLFKRLNLEDHAKYLIFQNKHSLREQDNDSGC